MTQEESKKKDWGAERRESFCVEDILPLVVKRMELGCEDVKSRVFSGFFSGFGAAVSQEELCDDSINPRLWRLLVDISTKLSIILERLSLEGEPVPKVENRRIRLSASSIGFTTQEGFEAGDLAEIRILVPIHPPVWAVLYGTVTAVDTLPNGSREVTLCFCDMEDEVRDVINHYMLNRQREVIRKQRGYDD